MILHITPHCRSHSGSRIIWGLSWNSLHITAWTTSPVVGNIPAGSVPALQVVNTVQRSLFMSITSHHEFFSLRSPLIIRLPLMKEPWRCPSLSWILAIVNNQYCYLLPPPFLENEQLWVMVVAEGKVKQHKAGSFICGQRKGDVHNHVLETCPLSIIYLSAIMVWWHSGL